jgi:hypothetical protein
MNATEAVCCWNPGTDEVAILPWPDRTRRTADYACIALACYAFVHQMTPEQRKLHVHREALRRIVVDKCDPDAVHRAFSQLEDYFSENEYPEELRR